MRFVHAISELFGWLPVSIFILKWFLYPRDLWVRSVRIRMKDKICSLLVKLSWSWRYCVAENRNRQYRTSYYLHVTQCVRKYLSRGLWHWNLHQDHAVWYSYCLRKVVKLNYTSFICAHKKWVLFVSFASNNVRQLVYCPMYFCR